MSKHNGRAMLAYPRNQARAEEALATGATEAWRNRDKDFFDPDEQLKELKQEAYREACEHFFHVFDGLNAHVLSVAANPKATLPEVLTAIWQGLIATGSWLNQGKGPTERAHQLGVERATLSHGAVVLCLGLGLPPSILMRDPDTREEYRKGRLEAIAKANARHK